MTRASDLAKLLGAGATINDGTTITTDDNTAQLTITSTDADSASGPRVELIRNSGSPANGDNIGLIVFKAADAAGNTPEEVIQFLGVLEDSANGAEDASLDIRTIVAGNTRSRIDFEASETVFNQESIDLDFRVESDANANGFFLEGSTGRIGMGTNDMGSYHANMDDLVILTSGSTGISIVAGAGHQSNIAFADGTSDNADEYRGLIMYNHNGSNGMSIYTDATERLKIDTSGNFMFNASVYSTADAKTTFTHDGNSQVGITIRSTSDIAQSEKMIQFKKNNASSIVEVGTITSNRTSTAYNTSSDYRLKENVSYDFDATSRLKKLKPCRFNFIADPNTTIDGFIAHEVTAVPEAITGEKDAMIAEVLYVDGDEIPDGKKVGDVKEASKIDPQGIDQSKLVPLLVKTIQELEARITALESA